MADIEESGCWAWTPSSAHRLPALVLLLRLGQALACEPSMSLIQSADHNEMRTLFAAKGLKHSAESKHKILGRHKHALRPSMKRAIARSQFAHIVGGNIERSNSTGINQFVEIGIEIRMFTDSGDVLHQVGGCHIAVIRGIDHSGFCIDA